MAAGGLGSLASVPSSGGSAAKMLGSSPSGGGHDTPRSEDGSWVLLRRSEGWPTAEELAEQQGALARQLIGALDKLPDAAAEAVANRLVAPTARFLLQGKIFRGPRGYLQHRARMRTYWAPGFSIEIEDIDTKDSGELPGHDGKPTTRVSWTLRGRPWGVDMAVEEEAEEADAAASLIVESRGVTILSFDGHVCVGGVNSYDFQAATEEARSRRREAASAGHARRQSHRGSTPSRSEMSLGRSDSSVECSDMSVGTSDHEHCPGGDEAQSVHARGQTNALRAETAAGTSASALTSPFEIDPDEVKFGTPPVRLGIGSYGEVFRAKWRGTTVAVKRLLDQRLEAAAMDALRTELEIMSRLRHPNIVLWMGCCTRPGSAFIVTEFMNGGSLFHLLHKPPRRNLPLAARLGLALQVAQGMLYLHSLDKPLVHRDLSSNNVLIDRRGNAKITDFGLSKTMSAANDGGASYLTTTKGTGTAEYMAPEILRVGGGLPGSPAADSAVQVEYTEKVDVYSYGVLLWEILTRRVPWQHAGLGTLQVITQLALRGAAATVETLRMDVADPHTSGNAEDMVPDGTLRELITRCWAEDPAERPSFEDIVPPLQTALAEADRQRRSAAVQLSRSAPTTQATGHKRNASKDAATLSDFMR